MLPAPLPEPQPRAPGSGRHANRTPTPKPKRHGHRQAGQHRDHRPLLCGSRGGLCQQDSAVPELPERGAGRPDQHPRFSGGDVRAVLGPRHQLDGRQVLPVFPHCGQTSQRPLLLVGTGGQRRFRALHGALPDLPRAGDALLRQGVPPVVGILPAADPARAGDPFL